MGRTHVVATVLSLTAGLASGATARIVAQEACAPCVSPVFQPTALRARDSISVLAPLASLLVPGTGQLLAARKRGFVYLTVEASLLGWHLERAAKGRRERRRYRDLAFSVARAPFMPAVRDTAFEYFEHMAKFIASGDFDTDPGPALVPPTDPRTFNGSVWDLAMRTFFPDPSNPPPVDSEAYRQALAFYRARAVGPNFRWSWESNPRAMQDFGRHIEASDDAFRRATILLGFVLANHLIAGIDAHVMRLAGREGNVESRVRFVPNDLRWSDAQVVWGVTVWF